MPFVMKGDLQVARQCTRANEHVIISILLPLLCQYWIRDVLTWRWELSCHGCSTMRGTTKPCRIDIAKGLRDQQSMGGSGYS